jgi:voltage-gated potassium channel
MTPKARRRAITLSVLRSIILVAVLVALYFPPLDRALDIGTGIRFAFGLLVLAAVIPWHARAILGSETPWLRAATAVGISAPALLLLFAAIYVVIEHDIPNAFTQPINRTDSLYFTMTTFATVGLGDIAPRAEIARIIAMADDRGPDRGRRSRENPVRHRAEVRRTTREAPTDTQRNTGRQGQYVTDSPALEGSRRAGHTSHAATGAQTQFAARAVLRYPRIPCPPDRSPHRGGPSPAAPARSARR